MSAYSYSDVSCSAYSGSEDSYQSCSTTQESFTWSNDDQTPTIPLLGYTAFGCSLLAQPPTPVPTPSPVEINDDEFVLVTYWFTADCTGTPAYIEVYNWAFCFPTDDVGVYLQWTLTGTENTGLTTTYYTDSSCETLSTTDTATIVAYPSSCTSFGDGVYYSARTGDLPDGEYAQFG